jgi:subtilisin
MTRTVVSRLLTALLVFALLLFDGDTVRGASAPVIPRDLMQKVQSGGTVRVIVELTISAAAQAAVDSDIIRDMRRKEVAEARDLVRAGLLGTAHSVVRQYQELPFIALEIGMDGLRTLDSLYGLVVRVVEDRLERPFLSESVPLVQADQVWAGGFGTPFTGNGTVVAILDTGVDKNHPFVTGKVVEEACFSSNNAGFGATSVCPGGVTSSFAPDSGMPCDAAINECDHGTHVAGIAAGSGSAFSGVAKGASIMAVQVFSRFDNPAICASTDPCIGAFTSDILAALERVYDRRSAHNFASVNLSLGSGEATTNCDGDFRKTIIDLLRAANIATVVASGNEGFTDGIAFPSCISTAVSVGSTGDGSGGATVDVVSLFSNSVSFLSLLAPGAVINSSVTPGTGFENLEGTSMAAPHVAGAFALLKEAGPSLTVTQMLSALQSTGLAVLDARNGITKPRIRILDALFALPLGDVTAPGKIADLKAGPVTQTTVTLSWTAPGDDGNNGTATNYDMRFSTTKFTDADWNMLAQVNGEPAPAVAGSAQNTTVNNLLCNRHYFFAIKTLDEEGNTSVLSNIATAKTGPCNKLAVNPRTLSTGEAAVAYDSGGFTVTSVPATVGPFDVQIDPATLPPGLSYNGSQAFTGTPTEAKVFNIAGTITDGVGSVLKARFRLRVANPVQITTTALRPGRVNVPYNAIPRAKDGVKAYTWTATLNSALPAGSTFAFDPVNGRISALVTAASSVDVTFQLTDAAGGSDTQTLTLTFN